MQGIFISYRRQDSQSAAGRLADHLREQMPEAPIFRDVETLEPGVDFVDAIQRALQSCGILLAVIGPRWSTMTDAQGQRRLEMPNDFTRIEIATALQRSDVRVIPVLVEGAQMPSADELPEDLKALVRRNAVELTDKRWEFDVSSLVETLRKAVGLEPSPKPVPQPPKPTPTGWKKWLWGGVGALVVIGAIISVQEDQNGGGDEKPPPVAAVTVTGAWQDSEGGRYQIFEQQGRTVFRGTSIHGEVSGAGVVEGNRFTFSYNLNGTPYQAVLLLSPDGHFLQGQYRGTSSNDQGMVALQRIQ